MYIANEKIHYIGGVGVYQFLAQSLKSIDTVDMFIGILFQIYFSLHPVQFEA